MLWLQLVRGFYEASLPFIVGSWDFHFLFLLSLLIISTLFLIYIARRLIDSEKNCHYVFCRIPVLDLKNNCHCIWPLASTTSFGHLIINYLLNVGM